MVPAMVWKSQVNRTMLNVPRFQIILYWSNEDSAFIAEVPELPGCAADGPTYQEGLANAQVVIQEWIETAQDLGRPIPEPRGRLMFADVLCIMHRACSSPTAQLAFRSAGLLTNLPGRGRARPIQPVRSDFCATPARECSRADRFGPR